MNLKEILNKNAFRFSKSLGQNFITDEGLLSAIVELSGVEKTDDVLEVGAGGGTLTRAISAKAAKVVSYEIDRALAGVLGETLKGIENAEVVFRDFMREDMAEVEKELNKDYVVIANLPYYITTPLIMRFIEQSKKCKRIVVTVQKEVAERLTAKAGTAEYGAVTVAVDALSDAKIVLDVPRQMFIPQPNVDSAVVRMDINKDKYNILDKAAFRNVVKVAFSSRRKTLVNNLINGFKMSRVDAEKIILSLNLPLLCRGETLDTTAFIKLTNLLGEYKKDK